MDFEKDSNSIISQPESPRRFRNLVLGLRVLALAVTAAGIVVSAVATPRSPIAIGILGPAFITTFFWSSIEFLFSVIKFLPTIRPSFSFAIDCFIALGSVVCLVWFGVYQPWWELRDAALDSSVGPLATEILFKVALGLGCASTFIEIVLCLVFLLE